MELTQKQELYISRYMRRVADALAGRLSDRQCDRALSRLQSRINEQINASGKAHPEDIDVLDVLRKLGTPENQADVLARVWGGETTAPAKTAPVDSSAAPASPSPQDVSSATRVVKAPVNPLPAKTIAGRPLPPPVWLGVLAWCAAQWDLPAWALRILTALVGAVTLPLALLVYMGVYFWLCSSGRVAPTSPLHWWRMIFRPVLTAFILGVIHFTGLYAIKGVYFAYDTWLKRDMPDISEWAWLELEAGRLFFWALVLLLPLALFSAMPLANAWDYSIKRFTQACIALYAVVVSFGIASFITGIILAFVREFTGG